MVLGHVLFECCSTWQQNKETKRGRKEMETFTSSDLNSITAVTTRCLTDYFKGPSCSWTRLCSLTQCKITCTRTSLSAKRHPVVSKTPCFSRAPKLTSGKWETKRTEIASLLAFFEHKKYVFGKNIAVFGHCLEGKLGILPINAGCSFFVFSIPPKPK